LHLQVVMNEVVVLNSPLTKERMKACAIVITTKKTLQHGVHHCLQFIYTIVITQV